MNRKQTITHLKKIVNKVFLGKCEYGEGPIIQVVGSAKAENKSPSVAKKTIQTCVSKDYTNS